MDIVALLDLIKEKIAKHAGESKEILSVREYVPPFRAYLVDTDAATYCVRVNGSDVTLLLLEKDSNNITWNISTGQKKESE
jgi:hypothetical protein